MKSFYLCLAKDQVQVKMCQLIALLEDENRTNWSMSIYHPFEMSTRKCVVPLRCSFSSCWSIGRRGDACHLASERWTRWYDRRDSPMIGYEDEENREEIFSVNTKDSKWCSNVGIHPFGIFGRVLDTESCCHSSETIRICHSIEIVSRKDSFLVRISPILVRSKSSDSSSRSPWSETNIGRRISSELLRRHLWTILGKETFLDILNRQDERLIDQTIHDSQLHSSLVKTYLGTSKINRVAKNFVFSPVSRRQFNPPEIPLNIAQTLLPILHKIEPVTNNEVQRHISISFISIVIHRPLNTHESEANGNQFSSKMPIDVARLSCLSGGSEVPETRLITALAKSVPLLLYFLAQLKLTINEPFGVDGPFFLTTLAVILMKPIDWNKHRILCLQKLLLITQLRSIPSLADRTKSVPVFCTNDHRHRSLCRATAKTSKPFAVYQIATVFFSLINALCTHLFKPVFLSASSVFF